MTLYKIFVSLLILSFTANVHAQKVDKKTVSVDVQMIKEGQRDIKITAEENGEKKIYEWQDNGTIPEDIKKQLAADNIDIQMLTDSEGEDREITIDVDATIMKPHKEIILLKKTDETNGNEEVYKWNGEGDMPTKMKELLEDHDIQIEALGYGDTHQKKISEKTKEVRKKMRVKAMKEGHDLNKKMENQYKVITIDDDGNTSIKKWNSDNSPEDMEDNHQEIKITVDDSGEEAKIFMFTKEEEPKLSDAYIGAHISSEGGAKIVEIQKDSPAAKANLEVGDIVKRLNGARVRNMENLLDLLKYYEPNDQLELLIERDGADKEISLTLGTRPKQFRL